MKYEIDNSVFNEIGIYHSFVNQDLTVHFAGKELGIFLNLETPQKERNLFNLFPELSSQSEKILALFKHSDKKIFLKGLTRPFPERIIIFDLFLFPYRSDPPGLHLIIHDRTAENQSCQDIIQSRNEISVLHKELLVKTKTLEEMREKAQCERDLLAKYFSRDLIDGILEGTISTELGGEVRVASILFCDLRNSTGIAEKIDPDLFMKLLNNLFTDLTDIIYGEGGSVNKFLGDGILATFGSPKEIADDALHCANVAIKIRKYLTNFNDFRPKYLKEPISIGTGIARGKIFMGNFGSVNQLEYSVLGDPVNIANRLESLTKEIGYDILMDEGIRQELGDRVKGSEVELSHIKGKIKEVKIYKLIDLVP